MEWLNSIQSNEKLSNLMDKINETCNALISALEVNAQSVWEYGWSIAHQINTEYVDSVNKKTRSKLQVGVDDYVVLYAPTFRDDGSMSAYCLNFESIKETFQEKTDKPCKIIVRLHTMALIIMKKI